MRVLPFAVLPLLAACMEMGPSSPRCFLSAEQSARLSTSNLDEGVIVETGLEPHGQTGCVIVVYTQRFTLPPDASTAGELVTASGTSTLEFTALEIMSDQQSRVTLTASFAAPLVPGTIST